MVAKYVVGGCNLCLLTHHFSQSAIRMMSKRFLGIFYCNVQKIKIYYTLNNALAQDIHFLKRYIPNHFEEVISTKQATLKCFCLIFLNYEAQKINRYIFYLKERQTFSRLYSIINDLLHYHLVGRSI